MEPFSPGRKISILYKMSEATAKLGESDKYIGVTSTERDGLQLRGRTAGRMFQLHSIDNVIAYTDAFKWNGSRAHYQKMNSSTLRPEGETT
jgi:hypothetical protein